VRPLEVLDGAEPGRDDRPDAEPDDCDPDSRDPDGCDPDDCDPGDCGPGDCGPDGAAAGAGASPQVSQYPSWIVPPQPGRVQVVAAVVVMAPAPVS
jgi:hypothetical protein